MHFSIKVCDAGKITLTPHPHPHTRALMKIQLSAMWAVENMKAWEDPAELITCLNTGDMGIDRAVGVVGQLVQKVHVHGHWMSNVFRYVQSHKSHVPTQVKSSGFEAH